MAWIIYVLRCSDSSLYVGMTADLHRRLKEHGAGKVSWTKPRLPARLVYQEVANTRGEARKREKYFKSGGGKKWLKDKLRLRHRGE